MPAVVSGDEQPPPLAQDIFPRKKTKTIRWSMLQKSWFLYPEQIDLVDWAAGCVKHKPSTIIMEVISSVWLSLPSTGCRSSWARELCCWFSCLEASSWACVPLTGCWHGAPCLGEVSVTCCGWWKLMVCLRKELTVPDYPISLQTQISLLWHWREHPGYLVFLKQIACIMLYFHLTLLDYIFLSVH